MNALWFLSLLISLTCALLATLLQQWVRRYLKVTQSRYKLQKRARIRTFLFEGVERRLLPLAVEALPTLLHTSLFLFFAGLVVFLWNVDLTIFKLVLSWVSVCTILYGCFTVMPIICHDSPYFTPLSLPVWYLVIGIKLLLLGFFRIWFIPVISFDFGSNAYFYIGYFIHTYLDLLRQGMQKTIEETALSTPSNIDADAFLWTFDSLDEDHELERFFSGVPGFRSSKVVEDPLPSLAEGGKDRLFMALIGLLNRTTSSDLLPEDVKSRRAMICKKAIASILDKPSFSTHAPLRFDEGLGDALPLDNNVSIPVSLDPIDQATTESRRIPATSPNLGSTRATHGSIDTSARTTHLSAPELSAFASAPMSNLKASPPDAVAVEHTAGIRAPSDGLDILSSASATPVLDDIPPSGPLLSSVSSGD